MRHRNNVAATRNNFIRFHTGYGKHMIAVTVNVTHIDVIVVRIPTQNLSSRPTQNFSIRVRELSRDVGELLSVCLTGSNNRTGSRLLKQGKRSDIQHRRQRPQHPNTLWKLMRPSDTADQNTAKGIEMPRHLKGDHTGQASAVRSQIVVIAWCRPRRDDQIRECQLLPPEDC